MYPKPTLLLVILTVAVGGVACLNLAAGCGNDLVKEVRSPGGKMKAVVFQRDCGATTGFSTQVSLLSSNESLPNESGNVFVATTDHGNAPAGAWGGPIVEASWTDDSHLLLRYDKRAGLSKREESLGNVSVRYETFAP
ncbi:MAG TPA: hypothetical protein VGJ66_17730 [Pyrinomonadaceae bacterium]|jgi:hypothetical protein